MKTYIATARLAHGPLIEYEVEASSKKDANWHARRDEWHRGASCRDISSRRPHQKTRARNGRPLVMLARPRKNGERRLS